MKLQKWKYRLAAGALTAALAMSTSFSAAAADTTFRDMEKGSWYFGAVRNLIQQGMISGYPDRTFRPNSPITTGESLKLILTFCGKEPSVSTAGHWAEKYLEEAKVLGILSPGGQTDPDALITRAEVSRILASAFGLHSSTASSPFSDTADPYAVALYHAGWISGSMENGKRLFRPQEKITRAELCSILDRIQSPGSFSYGSYQIPVAQNLPRNPYDPACFRREQQIMTYNGRETTLGIDVSYYQEDINWKQVKASGIDFVMIRLGYRGYETGKLALDKRFYEYLQGASEAGLKIGIYFFSQAIHPEEALEEAEFVLSHLKGFDITYPVVFDWEIIGVNPARTDDVDPSVLSACAQTFCDRISAAGYTPAIYYTKYLAYVCYELQQLGEYDIWYAEYAETPSFYYDFDMWQYTDRGSVPGIRGKVDMNLCMKPY